MKYITIFLIILLPICSLAEPVDTTEAKIIASNYYKFINPDIKGMSIKKTIVKQYKGIITRYTIIFNNLDYIIVSADNATVPIFAYSTENSFNEFETNPAYEWWVQSEYDELVYYVKKNSIGNTKTIIKWNEIKANKFNQGKSIKTVSPLIKTKWGQMRTNDGYCPGYNYFVPINNLYYTCNHCAAGCTAIAMAQIMKFWNFPNMGFDWCNMPNILMQFDRNGPNRPQYELERDAIAILIADCGTSALMHYCDGLFSSWAHLYDAKQALQNVYNFSNDMLHRHRIYTIDWKPKIKSSLDNGNPILYRGKDDEGNGHAFICDGYTSDIYAYNNFFHFNLGNNGQNDGYFYIDEDDGNPVLAYKDFQEAVFYIHPETPSAAVICEEECNRTLSISNINSGTNLYHPDYPELIWNGVSEGYNFTVDPIKPSYSEIITENNETRLRYYGFFANTISAHNATIPNKINANFEAFNNITLTNFKVEAGAKFSAKIIPCIDNSITKTGSLQNSTKNSNTESLNQIDDLIENINKEESNIKLSVFPNPNNGNMQVAYRIPENGAGKLIIFDVLGNQKLSYNLASENNNLMIEGSSLEDGIYFYSVNIDGSEVEKGKIVIIK